MSFKLQRSDLVIVIYLLFIMVLGLNPHNQEFVIKGLPIYLKEITIVVFYSLSFILLFLLRRVRIKRIIILPVILFLYAYLTTIFREYDLAFSYIFYPLFLYLVSLLVSYLYFINIVDYKRFLYLLSLLLVLISLVYAFYFPLGDSGYNRLKGPLGNAASIHVMILLCISVFAANLWSGYGSKNINLIFIVISIFLIILTGSRSALLGLLLFGLIFLIRDITFKKVFLFALLSIATVFIFNNFFAVERISIEDYSRTENLSTSLKIFSLDWGNIIFGSGYGTVWQWYIQDTTHRNIVQYSLILNQQGYLLYHPHSLILWALTELGLIGLTIVAYIFLPIFRNFMRVKDSYIRIIIFGVISTLPSFLFDFFWLKNWSISLIWWLFYFYGTQKFFDTTGNAEVQDF